jgi:hypothetical protein
MSEIINGQGRVGWRTPAAPASPSIITSGLVLNLDAGNAASYPGTGTTWTDLSGNGNNATLYNGAAYSSANGGVMVFDGINDYAKTSAGIFNNSSFSYNGWFKFSSLTGGIYEYQDNNNGFRLVANSNGTMLFRLFFTNGSYSTEITSAQLTTGVYKYISLNFELGVGAKIYINNTLIHTFNTTYTPQYGLSQFFSIGGGAWAGFGNYNSNNIQVYNRSLTSTEVTQNFNAFKSRYGY